MSVDLNQDRSGIIRVVFVVVAVVLLLQLLNLQVVNASYRKAAEFAGASIEYDYPSRGLIFDRDSQLLVVNNPVYEIEFVYNQFEPYAKDFDTLKFCRLLNITTAYFETTLDKNWDGTRFSKSKPETFLERITKEQLAAFQESIYQFPGFYIQERSARGYPHSNAAHVLGYIGEISPKILEDSVNTEAYRRGDYMGITGIERFYEYYLRGHKGFNVVEKDIRGNTIGSVNDGQNDTPPEAGYDLFTTIDLELQQFGESLMVNKIGGIVAIEPATGEILSMISTPAYDPKRLEIGNNRGQNYMEILNDSLQPFFNRGTQAQYPPGSLFKPLVALIGLQTGVITPDKGVSCGGAYYANGQRLTGCHNHPYCGSVAAGIQYSCNAYFVTVFRQIVDRYNEQTPRKGLSEFNEYLHRFGMGQELGVDFPGEKGGNVPSSNYYDNIFKADGGWRSIWIRSLSIGQGELLATNLQLANIAAAIGNKGKFITPHLVRSIRHQDGTVTKLSEYLKVHQTGIDPQHFPPVIDGMEMVVQAGTGRGIFIPDIPICGKTGTAENSQGSGEDHSIFFAFAPKDNPKIAIAVYVENGGFGATYAAPIAGLMIEKYIRGYIPKERQWMKERLLKADLIH